MPQSNAIRGRHPPVGTTLAMCGHCPVLRRERPALFRYLGYDGCGELVGR